MSDWLYTPPREPLQAAHGEHHNPIGLDGIEFIEWRTDRPQALGQVLEMLGFCPVARHRSREVVRYRQGGLNLIVNAHQAEGASPLPVGQPPQISAIALRVRDARSAYAQVLARGGWAVPTRAEVMELHIPAIHGVGGSRIYFVDRYREFSIYDVDFVPIPGAHPQPPAIAGLHFFGLVQYIGADRSYDWIEFYTELLGARLIPDEQRYGILPKGRLLQLPGQSPGSAFMLQLIEPEPDAAGGPECWQRIGLGVPDVLAAVQALEARGLRFVHSPATHPEPRGALSSTYLGSVAWELVHDETVAGAAT